MQECAEGKFKEAAETAANAPNGALRTQATITRLQQAPTVAGQKSPLIVYFGALLQKDKLNAIESVEMSRIALSQNRPDLVTNWMRDTKLTPSEPLGDLLKDVRSSANHAAWAEGDAPATSSLSSVHAAMLLMRQSHAAGAEGVARVQTNKDSAKQIYEQCGAREKLTMIHAEEGNVDALVTASGGKPGEQPNYTYLLQNLLMSNPPGAVALAKAIIKQPGPPMDKATICNEFIQRQLYAEATSFALEALADDVAEEGPMQARPPRPRPPLLAR